MPPAVINPAPVLAFPITTSRGIPMRVLNRLSLLLLALTLPMVVWGGETSSPLVRKVREATAIYRDVNVAISQGFVPATPCVSGPDHGAMGVHYVLVDRLN